MRLMLALAIVVTGVVGAASSRAQELQIAPSDRKQVERLSAAVDADDCDAIIKLGTRIIDQRSAPTLPPRMIAATYGIVTECETKRGMFLKALNHTIAGTKLEDSSDALWLRRLGLALELKKHDEAVATIEAMTQGRGAALNSVPVRWIYQLSRLLRDASRPDLRERLLKVVTQSSYLPNEPGASADGFRSTYAAILAERGDTAAARALVGDIEHPDGLIVLSLDPRGRGLLPAGFDARAETERHLLTLQQMMSNRPRVLDFVIESASLMRRLGRHDESLRLLRSVEAKIGDPKQWDDPDRVIWWWDGVGRTLLRLNRLDEAVTAFRQGAALKEGSSPNVSQVINLAAAQLIFGRPADALLTMAAFDDPKRTGSPYGEMQVRIVRGCANTQLGNAKQAQVDFDYIVAHEQDAPSGLTEILMCRGDLDEAAASMIRRLDKTETRFEALQSLSDFDPPPLPQPISPIARLIPQLKARADVQAAIARAGGTRRFRVEQTEI